ncbi:MAG: hypothetical protein WEC16_01975 [Anaerolineales bacterium]
MKKPLASISSEEAGILLDQTWLELEVKLRSAGTLAPQAGFTLRWKERQRLTERLQQRLRNNWLLASHGFAVLLFLTVGTIVAGNLLSQQASLLPALASGLLAFAAFARTLLNVTLSIFFEIPLGTWVWFLAICASLMALWNDLFRNAQFREGVDQ